MHYPTLLAGLALIHFLGVAAPGPNVILISHVAAATSRRAGLLAAGGIVAGSLVWFSVSLAGFGALLLEAGWLYRVLRILGGCYLVYLGIRLLAGSVRPPRSAEAIDAATRRSGNPFLRGLVTSLSNPKSAVFWTSIFLAAVPPHAPFWFYACLFAVVVVQASLWYGGAALVLSTAAAQRAYRNVGRWIDRIAGLLMAGLGMRLVAAGAGTRL